MDVKGQGLSCAGTAHDGLGVLCMGTWIHEDIRALLGGRRSKSDWGPCPERGAPLPGKAASSSCCYMIPQLSADPCLSCQLEHLGMKACFLLSSEQPLPRRVPFPALREALSSSGHACQWPRALSTSSGWCSVAPLEILAGSPAVQTRKQAQVVRPRQACALTVPLARAPGAHQATLLA